MSQNQSVEQLFEQRDKLMQELLQSVVDGMVNMNKILSERLQVLEEKAGIDNTDLCNGCGRSHGEHESVEEEDEETVSDDNSEELATKAEKKPKRMLSVEIHGIPMSVSLKETGDEICTSVFAALDKFEKETGVSVGIVHLKLMN